MALEYKSTFDLESIMPVLDEHVFWYGRIIKSYFEGRPFYSPVPEIFQQWAKGSLDSKRTHENVIEKLTSIHEGMDKAAKSFVIHATKNEDMPVQEYNEFSHYYEEFIMAMRRVERDRAIENSGFDEKTGLRSARLLEDDIKIELQRRARQGNPFSLALLKINHFEDSWRKEPELCLSMIQKTSLKIKECLRGFDDAYYMGHEYFLLALKHADMIGAEAAMARINHAITAFHISMPDDLLTEMTISALVYEPTPTDKLEDLIVNMKKDLVSVEEKAAIVKFNDISPLQRYAQTISKNESKDL